MALYELDGQVYFYGDLVWQIGYGENDKVEAFLAGIENLCDLKNSAGGQTLLHIAARFGNALLVKRFIDMGFEVDARNNLGVTPLGLAVYHGQLETIAILLAAKADIYDSQHGECLLQSVHDSCMARRKPGRIPRQIYRMFYDRVNADYKQHKYAFAEKLSRANCSLYLAVKLLRSKTITTHYVKYLGYHVDARDPCTGRTALHAAVEGTDLAQVKLLLLDNCADVNAPDSAQKTPLFYYNYASKDSSTKLEMLQVLLDRGASLTLASKPSGCTPLEYLLTNGKLETVSMVLQQDVDLTLKYRLDSTPLHFLARNTTPGIMATLLKARKFDVDARDQEGHTALMMAVKQPRRNLHSVEFLLDNGADVNAENNGQTPLCYAVSCVFQRITVDICKLLLSRGANIQQLFKTFTKKKVINEQATVFDVISEKSKQTSKLLLAQLALDSARGEPIKDPIRAKIESDAVLSEQYNVCKEQIEKMKVARINESLSLFELMTADEDLILHHAVDLEFICKADELMNDILRENAYYVEIIDKKVANIVKKLKSTEEFKSVATAPSSCPASCCIS